MGRLAYEVTRALGGEWHGSYGLAPGPGHSKRDRSLMIKPHRDDPDDVFFHSFAGDDYRLIKDDLRRRGVLRERKKAGSSVPSDPAAAKAAKEKAEQVAKQAAEDRARRRWRANQLWQLRHPIQGTIVETYLRNEPAIGELPLPPLDMLGFLPAGIADRNLPFPAMIAAHGMPFEFEPERLRIDEGSGVRLTSLHGPHKAPLVDPRKAHGLCMGMPIVLVPPNDGLALCICEGIETALSVHVASGMGAWAAGSANFMPALADAVPDYVESVTIWAEKGDAGQRGAQGLQERLSARGFEVQLAGVVTWVR